MNARPSLLIAHGPALDGAFEPEHHRRLRAACEPLTDAPVATFEGPEIERTEILLTGWGVPRIDAALLQRATHLRAIVHAGGTIKTFLDRTALERGIVASTAASANASPVAEFTASAVLLALKCVVPIARRFRTERRSRDWSADFPTMGSRGKRLGLVGASRVGQEVVRLLRPVGLEILAADPFLDDEGATALGVERVELDALARRSDIVSLHAPDLAETRGMIDAAFLGAMKANATLINTARGALVDHAALERELVSGRISALLDVTEPEPLTEDSPLWDLPNVVLTPHVAGSLGVERARLVDCAVAEVERFARGESFEFPVRLDDWERVA